MNTNRNAIIGLVTDMVKERMAYLGRIIEGLDEKTNLLEAGILDSLEFLDLIAALEERMEVELDLLDADPQAFTTVAGLAAEFMAALGNNRPVGAREEYISK
ncbi:MAG: acyl carrier protein [Bradymonadaceae bacterium]